MSKHIYYSILLLVGGCLSGTNSVYHSDTLEIIYLSHSVYQHISYMETQEFGKVPCNGLIYMDKNEALIFDSPVTDLAAAELIHWIRGEHKSELIAVVPTHFHVDCLGGLNEFHKNKIPSFAHGLTIELASENNLPRPQNRIDSTYLFKIGNKTVELAYFGEGHTIDNLVGYIPEERVLYGGCLIKSVKAGKGNLADANVDEWPATVNRVKKQYPDIELVIPGHGQSGGSELLDYTIDLFK